MENYSAVIHATYVDIMEAQVTEISVAKISWRSQAAQSSADKKWMCLI